ncbi:MAG: HDOD domain-containing protein, partial [Gammaproteobacteria bacterium]|nr:HDOD domain-containing protein [Gammaproteobacteria bacterium]
DGKSCWEAEQEVFGHTHCEVGAYLLGLWGLPNPIVESAAFHHSPANGAGEHFSPLTAVYLADRIVENIENGGELREVEFDTEYLDRLGLKPGDAWFDAAQEIVG